jgi:hypothetical protein
LGGAVPVSKADDLLRRQPDSRSSARFPLFAHNREQAIDLNIAIRGGEYHKSSNGRLGGFLLRKLCAEQPRPILVGTWAAATWAIRFYERHGFCRSADDETAPLLRKYWSVPERQIEVSVVLRKL